MKGLLEMIWDNAQTYDEFVENIEKQGYKVTAPEYLKEKFRAEKRANIYPAIEYVPSHPTIREIRSQI